MRTFFFLLSLSASTLLMGQAIDTARTWVVNGDFEQMDGKKLKRPGGIQYAKGWSSPTAKKADLFSENATVESTVSAPKNFAGEQMALSGSNYAGVRWWSYQNKEPRTYIQTQLKHKMKKDSLYCVRFYVTLGDLSKYSTGELGAWFGKDMVQKDDPASLTFDVTVPPVRTTPCIKRHVQLAGRVRHLREQGQRGVDDHRQLRRQREDPQREGQAPAGRDPSPGLLRLLLHR